jgi:hypothetical protein
MITYQLVKKYCGGYWSPVAHMQSPSLHQWTSPAVEVTGAQLPICRALPCTLGHHRLWRLLEPSCPYAEPFLAPADMTDCKRGAVDQPLTGRGRIKPDRLCRSLLLSIAVLGGVELNL